MDVVDLVETSSASALEHASVLQRQLRHADRSSSRVIRECRDDMHRLVCDIVTLRNAVELMKRQGGTAA